MVKVPNGFQVSEVILQAHYSAADTIAGILQVGDGNAAARYISASVSAVTVSNVHRMGQGAVISATLRLPYTYTANDTIDITTGALTGTASASTNLSAAIIVMGSVDYQP